MERLAISQDQDKFGVVVLLDALGARTLNMDTSKNYLKCIEKLKDTVRLLKELPDFSDVKSNKEPMSLMKQKLKFSYFGDSILITYATQNDTISTDGLLMVSIIVNIYFIEALKSGILLRGAFALGKYIESGSINLGPAIIDAASWFDQTDMIGVMVTPKTANYLKSLFGISNTSTEDEKERPSIGYVEYEVPLSKKPGNSSSVRTYILNWPPLVPAYEKTPDSKDVLTWYYSKIKSLPVPKGTEMKFFNTEAFILRAIQINTRMGAP